MARMTIHVDSDALAAILQALPPNPRVVVSGNFGSVSYRQPAGDLLLYPATSLHSVSEVTRGERIAAFFWIESLVRDGAAREMLFDLDQTVQALVSERGGDEAQVLKLTQLYHNLVRRWT